MKTLLEELLVSKRAEWQNNTMEEIKNNFLLRYSGEYINSNTDKEKNVVVYGLSQAGKTTLILKLMGIAEEYHKKVYDTLRADVKYGNSSTSTAIMYQKSENNKYGWCYKTNNLGSDEKIAYCSSDMLKKELKNIRKNVEKNEQKTGILYIYIPKSFFDSDSSKYSNINILDMPGVASKNIKEADYVKKITKEYKATAAVTVIVCEANKIEQLGTLEIDNDPYWREFPNKYFVVLTKAYNDEMVKKYFFDDKIRKDNSSFYDFVKKHYYRAKINVSKELEAIKCFPIDAGSGMEGILAELEDPDKKEVIDTANKTADNIRNYIQEHEGNNFKDVYNETKVRIKKLEERKCRDYEKEIKKLTDDILFSKKEIEKTEKQQLVFQKSVEELQPIYDACISALNIQTEVNSVKYVEALYKYMKNFFGGKSKIKDKDMKVFGEFKKQINNFICDYVSQYDKDICKADNSESFMFKNNKIADGADVKDIYNSFINSNKAVHNFKEACPTGFLKKLNYYNCRTLSKTAFTECEQYLKKVMGGKVKEYISERDEACNTYETHKEQIKMNVTNLARLRQSLKNKENSIIKIENEKNELIKKINHDRDILRGYQSIAQKYCNRQRYHIMDRINNTADTDEFLDGIVFLGILENDYNNITSEREESTDE